MSPAHHRVQRRWPVLALVAVVLVGLGYLARNPGATTPGGPPVAPGAMASPPNAESSSWYCTGQTTATGQVAVGSLLLTNTTSRTVAGDISEVTDSGARAEAAVAVPALDQIEPTLPAPSSGTWMSQVITFSGGGVAVAQAVHGASGWSETPCQSATSQQWYFPSGQTTNSASLVVSLFNPTSTPDVVDVSFVTPGAVTHPVNFQGIVLQPDQTEAQDISSYVQNQPAVATVVTTRTGRVVASELEAFSGSGAGLSVVSGSPLPESQWSVPQSVESAGGSSALDIFNPGSTTEDVTVQPRLASASLLPFTQRVGPLSTWTLATGTETRIPKGDAYSTLITATGGAGVVVGRTVAAASGATTPLAGISTAIDALSMTTPARRWVVPSPGSGAAPVISGVLPAHFALSNPTARAETYDISVMTPSGVRSLTRGTLVADGFVSLSDARLFSAGLHPLVVSASGPLSASEDVGPSGAYGVVTMPSIPLAAALPG